jgi:hypothetical protein
MSGLGWTFCTAVARGPTRAVRPGPYRYCAASLRPCEISRLLWDVIVCRFHGCFSPAPPRSLVSRVRCSRIRRAASTARLIQPRRPLRRRSRPNIGVPVAATAASRSEQKPLYWAHLSNGRGGFRTTDLSRVNKYLTSADLARFPCKSVLCRSRADLVHRLIWAQFGWV